MIYSPFLQNEETGPGYCALVIDTSDAENKSESEKLTNNHSDIDNTVINIFPSTPPPTALSSSLSSSLSASNDDKGIKLGRLVNSINNNSKNNDYLPNRHFQYQQQHYQKQQKATHVINNNNQEEFSKIHQQSQQTFPVLPSSSFQFSQSCRGSAVQSDDNSICSEENSQSSSSHCNNTVISEYQQPVATSEHLTGDMTRMDESGDTQYGLTAASPPTAAANINHGGEMKTGDIVGKPKQAAPNKTRRKSDKVIHI